MSAYSCACPGDRRLITATTSLVQPIILSKSSDVFISQLFPIECVLLFDSDGVACDFPITEITCLHVSRHIVAFIDKSGELRVYGNFLNGVRNFTPWGLSSKQPALFSNDRTIAEIAVGDQHVLLRTNNGLLYSFGKGIYGELGTGQSIPFSNDPLPVPIPADSTSITQIAAGYQISAFITAPHGLLFTFGSGAYYRLGHGDTSNCMVPTLVAALEYAGHTCPLTGACSGIAHIACGTWHMVAVGKDTTDVYSWGWNKFHQVIPKYCASQRTSALCKVPTRMDGLDGTWNSPPDKSVMTIDPLEIRSIDLVSCGARHSAIVVDGRRRIIIIGELSPAPQPSDQTTSQDTSDAHSCDQSGYVTVVFDSDWFDAPQSCEYSVSCEKAVQQQQQQQAAIVTQGTTEYLQESLDVNSAAVSVSAAGSASSMSKRGSGCAQCGAQFTVDSFHSRHWSFTAIIRCACNIPTLV